MKPEASKNVKISKRKKSNLISTSIIGEPQMQKSSRKIHLSTNEDRARHWSEQNMKFLN